MASVATKNPNYLSDELKLYTGLKKIIRLRRYMLISWLVCTTATVAILGAASLYHAVPHVIAYIVVIMLMIAFSLIWVPLMYSKCPRCLNLFFGGYFGPPSRVLAPEIACMHCELSEESLSSQQQEPLHNKADEPDGKKLGPSAL